MKKYTPLDGLRWSRNSDSALNNVPQTDVLGRAGGGKTVTADGFSAVAAMVPTGIAVRAIANKPIFGLISILMLC